MQSLMQSLSPEQRAQLDEMMRSLFMQDERLEAAMRQLGMHLSDLLPLDEMAQRLSLPRRRAGRPRGAMRLMEEMQRLDALERELRGTRTLEDLAKLNPRTSRSSRGRRRRATSSGCRRSRSGSRTPATSRARTTISS